MSTAVKPVIRDARIMGVSFRDTAAQNRYQQLVQGEQLAIEPEPANEFDPYAVKILTQDGVHLGYVPKEISAVLHVLTDVHAKLVTVVTRIEKNHPRIGVGIVLEEPG